MHNKFIYSAVAVHLGYGTLIWLSVLKLLLKCDVVSLYSAVKQQLKCNTDEVCNCLIQFLCTMFLSIEECVFVHSDFPKALYLYYVFLGTYLPEENSIAKPCMKVQA
jgi:hypothetical protein